MKILDRTVEAKYSRREDLLWVDLMLKEGDCPEGKNNFATQLCPGGCQQTYMCAVYQKENLITLGGITKDKFVCLASSVFCKKNELSQEEGEALVKKILVDNREQLQQLIPHAEQGILNLYEKIANENFNELIIGKEKYLNDVRIADAGRELNLLSNGEIIACINHVCSYIGIDRSNTTVFQDELNEIASQRKKILEIAKKMTLNEILQMCGPLN